MPMTTKVATSLGLFMTLGACSLIVDTNPDGVVPTNHAGSAGRSTSSAGSSTTAGTISNGGSGLSGAGTASTLGGAPAAGASNLAGGGSAGSLTATGGVSGLGGNNTSAGTTATTGGTGATAGRTGGVGGITAAGTGGVATGGVAGGGTGGAATGGIATGGVATGGKATGGAATGGVATGGAPTGPMSCRQLATKCQNESCCTSLNVPAGSFPMGRSESTSGTDYYPNPAVGSDVPEHLATISAFALDKYEVTVGRFRKFVENYDAWRAAGNPKDNAGAHPIAPFTGWGRSWVPDATNLPADAAALRAALKPAATTNCTWTDTAGANEAYPLNCVTWYEAFAFCIWDGARLPTEAEREYVGAGGALNRLYPWGQQAPDASRANYVGSEASPLVDVGGKPAGAGAWGHLDLAGSLWEWAFDYMSTTYYGTSAAPAPCNDCANVTQSDRRLTRGGAWHNDADFLRVTSRGGYTASMSGSPGGIDPISRQSNLGIRCARALQP